MNNETRDYLIGLGMGVQAALQDLGIEEADPDNVDLVLRGWKEGRTWIHERSDTLLTASNRFVPPKPDWED